MEEKIQHSYLKYFHSSLTRAVRMFLSVFSVFKIANCVSCNNSSENRLVIWEILKVEPASLLEREKGSNKDVEDT